MRPSGPPLFSSLPPTIRAIISGAKTRLPAHAGPGGTLKVPTSESTATEDEVTVKGWIRSVRGHKNVTFVAINDGSTEQPLQAVIKGQDLSEQLNMGMAVEVKGKLQASRGKGQDMELVVRSKDVLGGCDLTDYPIQRKHVPRHVLREHAHLRFKTTLTGAIMRLRDGLMRDWHDWFENNDFLHIHTPILTSSDCEGAGEVFTLLDAANVPSSAPRSTEVGSLTTASSTSKKDVTAASSTDTGPKSPSPAHDAFFPHPVNLTVSSQLHLEAPTHALSRTYTLSPSFRSEKSMTSRHLAEFYMLEGEVVVDTLDGLLDIVEDGIRSSLLCLLDGTGNRHIRMRSDLEAIRQSLSSELAGSENHEAQVGARVDLVKAAKGPFKRLTYTEAIEIINTHLNLSQDESIKWCQGISTEHEKWLAGHFGPTFVTQYPAALKPFYMLPTTDNTAISASGATVECFDLLVPEMGELIGGSLREHRYPQLLSAIKKAGLKEQDYGWYLDLRKFGSMPHGGWGMGWERYISWISGVGNVRDVVAFPRYMGHCKY